MRKPFNLFLVMLMALLLLAPGVRAESVNPKVDQTVKSVVPGPGIPAGWQAPATPTSIPSRFVEMWEEERRLYPDYAATTQMLFVAETRPSWTGQFPWMWEFHALDCGRTQVVFGFPVPDQAFIYNTFGSAFAYTTNVSSAKTCTMGGVQVIDRLKQRTQEDIDRIALEVALNFDMELARLRDEFGGQLNSCGHDYTNGRTDSIHVCFNFGNASERFDVPAYLDTTVSRVRVPIRFVSEMMGGVVTWNEASQTVTIEFAAKERVVTQPEPLPGLTVMDRVIPGSASFDAAAYKLVKRTVATPRKSITLGVGQSSALVDGKTVALDAAPVIKDGRTMVPLRFIAEELGAKVYWVGDQPIFDQPNGTRTGTYQVHIFTPFWPYFDYPDWFLETRAQRFQEAGR